MMLFQIVEYNINNIEFLNEFIYILPYTTMKRSS